MNSRRFRPELLTQGGIFYGGIDMAMKRFRLLSTVVRVFGPEQGAIIIGKASHKLQRTECGLQCLVNNLNSVADEVASVRRYLGVIGNFIGLGCVGNSMGLRAQDITWVVPNSYSRAESALLHTACNGRVITDLSLIDMYTTKDVVIDPVALDQTYIYLQKGLQYPLALFDLAPASQLYLIYTTAKLWYPYLLLSDSELIAVPLNFTRFRKVITAAGFLDFGQLGYL
jgi:hypothetical protein